MANCAEIIDNFRNFIVNSLNGVSRERLSLQARFERCLDEIARLKTICPRVKEGSINVAKLDYLDQRLHSNIFEYRELSEAGYTELHKYITNSSPYKNDLEKFKNHISRITHGELVLQHVQEVFNNSDIDFSFEELELNNNLITEFKK